MLEDRQLFSDYLIHCYAIIRASEDLIDTALDERMPARLRAYYEKHLTEEHDHAKWLLDDLKSLGLTPAPVDWQIAPIVGMQYYLIKHAGPEALLGYMAALETNPMPLDEVAKLESLHGKDAMRTVRFHAEHDRQHGPDVIKTIAELGDSINHYLVIQTFKHTTQMLNLISNETRV